MTTKFAGYTIGINSRDENECYRINGIRNQSVENAGVAFVKGANKRNEFLKRK